MDGNNNLNQNQQPNMYGQPQPVIVNNQIQTEQTTSVGEWMITMLLMGIPCVGLIMLFVWAFGSSTQKSKSNWAKATLIWAAIGMVIGIIAYAIMGATIISLMENGY